MRKLSKFFLLTAAAVTLCAASAHAADMRVVTPAYKAPPVVSSVYNWTGIYGEVAFQYGADVAQSFAAIGTGGPGTINLDLGKIPNGPGVIGGLRALYQGQNTGWVFGADADIGWLNASSTGALTVNGSPVSLSLSNASNYIGNVNAVLGYSPMPDGRLLLSVEGGFAFGGAKPNLSAAQLCVVNSQCSQAASDTSTGYDIGGRLDYEIPGTALGVFIKGTYTHLGDRSLSLTTPAGIVLATSTTKYDWFTQQAGLTFKFVGPQ